MLAIPGVLILINSLLSHNILSKYSHSYLTFNNKDKHEVVGRINCCLYQFYVIYVGLTSTNMDELIYNSQIFASLMFFDMIHYLFYVDKLSNYLHHIVTILIVIFVNSSYANYETLLIFNYLLMLFESTNPPMSISWLANKFGYKEYSVFKAFCTITFIHWSYIRIFYLIYYIYNLTDIKYQILLLPFLGLNLFWFKALVDVYLKVIFKQK